jgi:hypothetical protein
MRGEDERSGALFSYVDLEARVGKDRPLRTIRPIANEALTHHAAISYGTMFMEFIRQSEIIANSGRSRRWHATISSTVALPAFR